MTQRVQCIPEYGERRDALSQEWTVLAKSCGFLPLLLPNDAAVVRTMLETLPPDGILLTGGNDLSAYGGDAPERDETERVLIEMSIEKKIPLLGICRGMQMLLDHFGVPLEQVENHVRVEHPLDSGESVNSFHSWGTHHCGSPLLVLHRSSDGVVEEISHAEYPWIHGMMWHPERYSPLREQDIQRIKEVFSL